MRTIFAVFGMLFLLSSCFKKEDFPSTPEIEFQSFDIFGDSAVLTIKFQDGEGDIGLEPEKLTPPFDINSEFHYNLFLKYYEKVNGQWQAGLDLNGDPIIFRNRLRPIYTGKPKSIKGVIEYTIEPIFYNLLSMDNDTIKYEIQLVDRELNQSDWIETETIIR